MALLAIAIQTGKEQGSGVGASMGKKFTFQSRLSHRSDKNVAFNPMAPSGDYSGWTDDPMMLLEQIQRIIEEAFGEQGEYA